MISSTTSTDKSISALASYLKGVFLSSGICPNFLPRDPRQAFKEFENAARGGEHRGWFRLARDYEGVGDMARVKDCLERGVKRGDCECTYVRYPLQETESHCADIERQRLGMAQLLGQLNLPSDPAAAVPLLRNSAKSSTIDAPHPAYVFGMLLAGELELPPNLPRISPRLLLQSQSQPQSAPNSADEQSQLQIAARESLERAAFLCHPPAQYKLGFLYEHASVGCPYDPLMSVQWYSLASQNGEIEADMELSKWFLCGADGIFAKNEDLARTFAEKAARKGHPNGCFAMGYYFE